MTTRPRSLSSSQVRRPMVWAKTKTVLSIDIYFVWCAPTLRDQSVNGSTMTFALGFCLSSSSLELKLGKLEYGRGRRAPGQDIHNHAS
jgi:hypothetical protein